MDLSDSDELNEKWNMIHHLLIAFMSDYTEEPIEYLRDEFARWADGKTNIELAEILGVDTTVKKVYKNTETMENLHTKEDILKSMFNDMGSGKWNYQR